MSKHKYRQGKLKLEHHIIEGFRDVLEKIASLEYVEVVIPGRIYTKGGKASKGEKQIKFQYPTKSGAKLLIKKGITIQEIFVVTSEPQKLKEYIENLKDYG